MALWQIEVFERCDNGQPTGSSCHEQWEGDLLATVYGHTEAEAAAGAELVVEQRDGIVGAAAQQIDSASCEHCGEAFGERDLTLYVSDHFDGPPEVATELWCADCHEADCGAAPVYGPHCPRCLPEQHAAARLRAEAGPRSVGDGEAEHAEIYGEAV